MSPKSYEFEVSAVCEIDSHIGTCVVGIRAYDHTDFEISYVTNKFGGEMSEGEISEIGGNMWREIAEEVHQHFVCMFEAQCDAMEDR